MSGEAQAGASVTGSWEDIDWDAPRPGWEDVKRSHERVGYEPLAVDDPAITAVLDAIRRTHVNGGALFAVFGVTNADDAALRWFAGRNRFAEYDFFPHFLGSDAVRTALPALDPPRPLGRDLGLEESWTGTLTLDGELAATLVHGGAYGSFEGTASEAKRLAGGLVDAIVGPRHADFRVHRSHRAWTPWFADIAWDATWILIDVREQKVFLLAVTDSD